jgi:hypothetical protein
MAASRPLAETVGEIKLVKHRQDPGHAVLCGECQKEPGDQIKIGRKDRTHFQSVKITDLEGPAPNRSESCATAIVISPAAPSADCSALP